MNIDKNDTAVVFIDPQNEVLSEKGRAWPLVHESLQENHTIENMERIFKAAKAQGLRGFHLSALFLSHRQRMEIQRTARNRRSASGMFARKGVLNLDGLAGSGADCLERFKPYIQDGNYRGRAASRVGSGDQRPGSTAPQTQDRQDYSRRDARQHVRRISPARINQARFRGRRRERCDPHPSIPNGATATLPR